MKLRWLIPIAFLLTARLYASDPTVGARIATITINPTEVTPLHLRPEFESTIRAGISISVARAIVSTATPAGPTSRSRNPLRSNTYAAEYPEERIAMAKGTNKAFLLGHVGKDPEIRSTASGMTVASFSLATADRQKDSHGNWEDKAEWHSLVAFQRTAEIVRDYVKKGIRLVPSRLSAGRSIRRRRPESRGFAASWETTSTEKSFGALRTQTRQRVSPTRNYSRTPSRQWNEQHAESAGRTP
jgi:hypothetical protein